jgi:hypothetical protein
MAARAFPSTLKQSIHLTKEGCQMDANALDHQVMLEMMEKLRPPVFMRLVVECLEEYYTR